MSNFCDLCAWETNEKVTRVGNDMWCETCIEAALPIELGNIFSILSHFIPEGFNKQALEIAA